MSPLVSVVVPIYNVERYLAECLESLAHQTLSDLEVIMVDDGSTDSSAVVAGAFAERDARFRLVQQENGGLGHARNTGARRASGEFITFVDSDDVVVTNAYELLVTSLQETGSDFASGNYHRLTVTGTWQSAMVAETFRATRLRTHVTKHQALLNDRTAWNKVFRRSFWDKHGFQWPEGVLYEDIPVTLPAHVLASSVDVLRQPIYLWRARVGDSTSITQRRTEPRAIRDRTAAVDGVSRFLAGRGLRDLKKAYDRSVAEQDLRYFLSQLDLADDEFRALFLDLTNDYFDRADDDVFDALPAVHRLQWHLARRRLLPELLEAVRFEKSGEIDTTPVVRKGRRFWGDYPFRGDPGLAIPDHVYRLERDEIPLRASIDDVFWQGDRLTVVGWAHIAFMDLSKEGSARIRLTLEESGHPERVVPMQVRVVRRPDVTETSPDGVTNYDWCGFEATVAADALRHRGRFRDGHWRLRVEVRSHGVLRRKWLARTEPGRAKRPAMLLVDGVRVVPTSELGDFAVRVSTKPAEVHDLRVDGTVLEFHGLLHGRALDPAASLLRVARSDGTATHDVVAATGGGPTPEGHPFVVRLDTATLGGLDDDGDLVTGVQDHGDGIEWTLALRPDGTGRGTPLVAAAGLPQPRLLGAVGETVVRTNRSGRLRVLQRHFRPEVDHARWTDDGRLELTGSYFEPTGRPVEWVLRDADRAMEYSLPVTRLGSRFEVYLDPAALPTIAGAMPLPEGRWGFFLRGEGHEVRVKVDHALLDELPVGHELGQRSLAVVDLDFDSLTLLAGSELPPQQTSRVGRERLQSEAYPAFVRQGLRDQVLVDGYADGAYGGDARAVVEELRRRHPDLPVVWSVVEGQAVLPDGVTAVPRYGERWYEALARSRYVVATDLRGVPELAKPSGQRVLQTWHGVPVGGVGMQDPRAASRYGRAWPERARREAAQWDLLTAAGPDSAEALRRGFEFAGTVLETGLPRHDVLVGAAAAETASAVRRRLGIAEGVRMVLYAPSYRHDLPHRRSLRYGLDRFRFELDLDLDGARAVLGNEAVLVVRPHPKSVDGLTWADGVTVIDASRWPDSSELVLAADVVVTDRSSIAVDATVAGKPVVRWDPAPVTGTPEGYPDLTALTGEAVVGDAVTMLRAALARRDVAPAATDLLATWCPLVDGKAGIRAVDALLGD